MKQTHLRARLLSLVAVCLVVAAISLFAGCGTVPGNTPPPPGDGAERTITVTVVGQDAGETPLTITTTASSLREALEEEHLIEGDEGSYGLYVKVVNGERADYDTDGAYWAFYRDDTLLMSSVDATPIADGDVFRIVYTK